MKYTINVIEEDIKKGIGGDCHKCPIALAARRTFINKIVIVFDKSIHVSGIGLMYIPIAAQEFIDSFDVHATVKPFSFIVEK
jgi:hypothetical protein